MNFRRISIPKGLACYDKTLIDVQRPRALPNSCISDSLSFLPFEFIRTRAIKRVGFRVEITRRCNLTEKDKLAVGIYNHK